MWVVAHTDGVYADALQLHQASPPYVGGHRCSQYAGIVVQAYAFHLHPLAVEGKAPVGREVERAQTDADSAMVKCRVCCRSPQYAVIKSGSKL